MHEGRTNSRLTPRIVLQFFAADGGALGVCEMRYASCRQLQLMMRRQLQVANAQPRQERLEFRLGLEIGPSIPNGFASRSMRRALLTPQLSPGSHVIAAVRALKSDPHVTAGGERA